jgi:hypothetical protein
MTHTDLQLKIDVKIRFAAGTTAHFSNRRRNDTQTVVGQPTFGASLWFKVVEDFST